MSEQAIVVSGVWKRFGQHEVLRDMSLQVERGRTYAFLGRNGAGKTTTIKMLLGLLTPDAGELRILGLDPQRQAIEVRRRIGYLAEDQRMFGWMRISELLRFMEPFYPGWDRALARDYVERFELDPKAKVGRLSKGQNVRLGLLLALAHRPELVILDDPTLGLDPIMRKELLRDIIDTLQGRGATVFFSSHLLYEIEPVADIVAILDHGRIIKQTPTEVLRSEVKRFIIATEQSGRAGELPGVIDVRRQGGQVAVTSECATACEAALESQRVAFQVLDLNLDEIFEAYVIGKADGRETQEPGVERVA